ncbi:MAG: isocitrate lyase/phosphoenolpyruvate mutase family protein [Deltaproteobacteria bacterium]|nr:MAG: isocitrate lyase/phosphoenolpyruvate mutase family protein [Deltaproteobacteria bacterium]
MDRSTQRERAERFLRLHDGPDVLVVGSVWDPGSAVLFEREGFEAIATSSAGVAFSLGYPDGERVPRDEMLAAIARVVRATRLPVSADVEMGYGRTAHEVSETCRGVLDAGAIGVNLEDATGDDDRPLVEPELQAEKIRAVRATADAFGIHLVINARTDVYLLQVGEEPARFAEAVRRTNLYRQAGADCLFVPGVVDRGTIARLVREIDGPLNVLAVAGTPPVAELAAVGVRRVSQGSGPARAALATARRVARELRTRGTYTSYTAEAISYADANRLFERGGAPRRSS